MTDQLDPNGSTGSHVAEPPVGKKVAADPNGSGQTDDRRAVGASDVTDQPSAPPSWPTATPPAAPTAGSADPAHAAPGPLFPAAAGAPIDTAAAHDTAAPHDTATDALPPLAPSVPATAGKTITAESPGRATTTVPADPAAAITAEKSAPAPPTGTPWTGARAPFASNLAPASSAVGRGAHSAGYGPAASFPVPEGPTRAAMATDVVTCPECGQLATVDMARRQADDFCKRCDFPLFWARGTVIAPDGEESGASLRRLPGTVGRAATAALICPHCSEPNSPAAEICVRCALSLHPVDIPEPEPVLIPEPEPEPEPEPVPKRGFDWWWVVAAVMALITIALVIGLNYLQ